MSKQVHLCILCGISLMPWEDTLCNNCGQNPEKESEDFLIGKTCNPDAPEECESCQ